MALIRATCSSCGDVEIPSRRLTLRSCLDNDTHEYRFTCPKCRRIQVKEAEQIAVEVLRVAGVTEEDWVLPDEMWERHDGPTICHDDVIDLHEELKCDPRVIFEELGSA